jgi:hypothetical protein
VELGRWGRLQEEEEIKMEEKAEEAEEEAEPADE